MRILIATNHSYMFYRFRKELVEALMQEHEVILSTPFVGHAVSYTHLTLPTNSRV